MINYTRRTKPLRRTSRVQWPYLPRYTPSATASASRRVLGQSVSSTPILNFLGTELPTENRDSAAQEVLDYTKYSKLAKLLQDPSYGWAPFLREAYKDEVVAESNISKRFSEYQWVFEADQAMAVTHPDVLYAYMTGNPTQQALSNSSLRATIQIYDERSQKHASIYIRHLTIGMEKNNLTVEQAEKLVIVARQYAERMPEKWKETAEIDKYLYPGQWRSVYSKNGFRALVTNSNNQVSSFKVYDMLKWAGALERLAKDAKASKKKHIRSLYYIGYALDAKQREREHLTNGHQANSLIHFTRAVLDCSDWCTDSIEITTHSICLLPGEDGAAIGEALMARGLSSYHFHGGFNIAPCGTSIESVYRKNWTAVEREAYWVDNRKWLAANTLYNQNLKDELARRKIWQRAEWVREGERLEKAVAARKLRRDKLREELARINAKMDWDTVKELGMFEETMAMYNKIEKATRDPSAQG